MIALLILSGVIVFIVYRFKQEVKESYRYAGRTAAPVRSRILPVPRVYRQILLKYFPYYGKLSALNRRKFERKVAQFIYGKRFIPRQVNEVTTEAKVLIAACAVQLTFGLPQDYLRFFNKILVYPNDYYSSITKRFHKGEVNPRFGIIVISWQSFIDGYLDPHDSKNLGLHEMAHALRLEQMIRSEKYPPFEEGLLAQFDDYARTGCAAIRTLAHGLFFVLMPAPTCTNFSVWRWRIFLNAVNGSGMNYPSSMIFCAACWFRIRFD